MCDSANIRFPLLLRMLADIPDPGRDSAAECYDGILTMSRGLATGKRVLPNSRSDPLPLFRSVYFDNSWTMHVVLQDSGETATWAVGSDEVPVLADLYRMRHVLANKCARGGDNLQAADYGVLTVYDCLAKSNGAHKKEYGNHCSIPPWGGKLPGWGGPKIKKTRAADAASTACAAESESENVSVSTSTLYRPLDTDAETDTDADADE